MKKSFLLLASLAFLPLVSCDQKTATEPPKPNETEVERRVQERLAEEHRAEQERKLQEKEQSLTERAQTLAERERDVEHKRAEAEAERARLEAAQVAAREAQRAGPQTDSPRPVAQAATGQTYELFYRQLDNDGDWIETDRYGYVWRPTVALHQAGWRPYADGYWASTEDGWMWVSNERFGWATYHYGRWAQLSGLGWVWVPGDEWAPAWVSWRHGDVYVGWAPLPPAARFNHGTGFSANVESEFGIGPASYVFVETVNFCAPLVRDVFIAQTQNIAIINQTTNVTNITYNNKTIINRGPRVDLVAARARQPVKHLKIEKINAAQSGAAVVNGDRLQVAAPEMKNAGVPVAPPRVAQRMNDVQLENEAVRAGQQAENAAQKAARQQEEAARKMQELAAQQKEKDKADEHALQEQQARKAHEVEEAARHQAALERHRMEEEQKLAQEQAREAEKQLHKQQENMRKNPKNPPAVQPQAPAREPGRNKHKGQPDDPKPQEQ